MSNSHATLAAAALSKKAVPTALGRDNLLSIFESTVGPAAFVFSLWSLAYYFEDAILPPYLILSTLVFALTFPGQARLQSSMTAMVVDIALNWTGIAGLLLFTGLVTGYINEFSKAAMITWLWVAPLTELGASFALRSAAPPAGQTSRPQAARHHCGHQRTGPGARHPAWRVTLRQD